MKKGIQKFIAMILALALCAGQLICPVYAVENQEAEQPAEEVTVTVIEGGTVTVTTSQDASTVVTVTETSKEDAQTGEVVDTTVTEVKEDKPEAGLAAESTETQVVTTSGDGDRVQTDTQWESENVQTDSGILEDTAPDITVQVDTETVVTVEGSEESDKTVTYSTNTNTETTTVTGSGQEHSETVDTTVTTTTTENVLFEEEDTSKTEVADPVVEEESVTGQWSEGEETDNEWVEGTVLEGTAGAPEVEKDVTTELEASNPGEATIVMKPDGETVTVEEDVSIDEVLEDVEIPDGAKEIVRDGKVVGYEVTTVTTTSTQDPEPEIGETKTEYSEEKHTPTEPEGYTEGTVEEAIENGKVITTTEAVKNEAGDIIGYKVTKTTVTENTDVNTTESARETQEESAEAEKTMTLPERPQESVTTDAAGNTTTVTVEDIVENGTVVGYRTVSVVTNAENKVTRTESHSIYGTVSSGSTVVEKDPETEVETVKTTVTSTEVNEIYTTTVTRDVTLTTERTNEIDTTITTETDTYQLVETEEGLFFRYQGVMYPVVEMPGHGKVAVEGLEPTVSPTAANDLAETTSITNPPSVTNTQSPSGSQFKYIDYGLISDFRVTKADGGNTSEVHLYKLVDEAGNAFFAYCADLDTTAYRNTMYNISNAKDENYYQNNQDKEAYEHLQTIAYNGYWGTSEGLGSMEQIRELLKKYGKDSEANSITDGEAMTATQAAIWYYGNKSDDKLVNSSNPAGNVSDATSRKNIKALFDILIGDALKNSTKDPQTDLLDKEDITGAKLELKGKAVDEETGKVKTDENGNEKYKTDLTFSLAVEKSSITGNLKVVVRDQNGNVLREEQLATDDSNFVGKLLAGNSTENGTDYTIKDLEIAEGVKINLNLEGYQNLEQGVYIYTAASGSHEDSQTFIGIAEGKRDVNLSVDLKFDVEDPKLSHRDKTEVQKRTDTRVDTKTDHRTDTRLDTQEITTTLEETLTEANVKVYGTQTETETYEEVTKEEKEWEYTEVTVEEIDEDEPEAPVPEDVTVADVPVTGDISFLWAAISLCSLGGMVLVNRKREEEEA